MWKQLTGEPCAGELHARFGGRGGESHSDPYHSCFHEDWELDATEPDEAISQFLRSDPSLNEIDRIVAQIRQYVSDDKDDAALEHGLIEELGCYYLPSADDGMSVRDWLQHVVKLLNP